MNYQWDFGGLLPYTRAFAWGVVVTIELTLLSSAIGTLCGVPLAVALRGSPLVARPLAFLIDVIRAVPTLVLIFFFYYFPYRDVLGVSPPSGFAAVLLTLVVAQACYTADLIRATIDQVPRAQVLGVEGIGFKPHQVVWYVVVPSVVRQALPGHIALWIGNLKLSSLASVIGVPDAVFVAKIAMSQSFRSLEAWTVVAAIYAALVLPLTYGLRALERSNWIKRQ